MTGEGGGFKLGFAGDTTVALPFDAISRRNPGSAAGAPRDRPRQPLPGQRLRHARRRKRADPHLPGDLRRRPGRHPADADRHLDPDRRRRRRHRRAAAAAAGRARSASPRSAASPPARRSSPRPRPAAPTPPRSAPRGSTPPGLSHPLEGIVYLATPHQNPFNSLLAFYISVNDPQSGTVIKLPGLIEADPATGQLTATISEFPQLPLEDLQLEFLKGSAAPFKTGIACGAYAVNSEMTPWTAPEGASPTRPTASRSKRAPAPAPASKTKPRRPTRRSSKPAPSNRPAAPTRPSP